MRERERACERVTVCVCVTLCARAPAYVCVLNAATPVCCCLFLVLQDLPRQVGFLHGTTAHLCACRQCAAAIKVGNPCPMCRTPIERILSIF